MRYLFKFPSDSIPSAGGGGGTGTVSTVATGAGLTGGPITSVGTISLAPSGATSGAYGGGSSIPTFTVDQYGRLISAGSTPLVFGNIGSKPTTLSGYGITDAALSTVAINGSGSIVGGGDLTASRTLSLQGDQAAPGSVKYYGTDTNGVKGYFALPTGGGTGTVSTVSTGTGLTGGPISTTGTIALADTAVTPGTYGTSTQSTQFTVDAQGRLTNAVGVTITPAFSSIIGKPTTLAGYGISDAVRTVNGILPDAAGNVPVSLTAVQTGTFLARPTSAANGVVYVVSGDATAPLNGKTYIYETGTAAWYEVVSFDVASADARYVNVSGDTMTGPLALSADPATAMEAATKQYVDNADNAASGVTVGTYGSATHTPTITVDSRGRVTAAVETEISLFCGNY